jgi:hypothetical protein
MIVGISEHSKPVRLAAAALTAGIDNDWPKASRYVQRINDECGPDSLPYALMGWCDTLAMHATDGQPIGRVGAVKGMAYETGALTDDVPPRVQWAQKVVKARAEMDQAAFTALVNELAHISDGNVRGSYVGAVLETAALSIRSLPRGYARMGSTREA